MTDTYLSIATIAYDQSLAARVTACAAQEGEAEPDMWAADHRWQYAAQPGWGAAWDSALAGGIQDPGGNPGVITDGQILSAVQSLQGGG